MRSVPVQNPLLFTCAYGSFFWSIFIYFSFSILYTSTGEKQKRSLLNLYNIVIIQKDLFLIFFFLYKKSQSVAAQLLVGREWREREICPSTKKVREFFLHCPQSDSHLSDGRFHLVASHLWNPDFSGWTFHFRSRLWLGGIKAER